MTSSRPGTHGAATPTLSVVLGKLKVGGLVLLATFLVAGTAEAATGGALTLDGPGDPVAGAPATGPSDDPVEDVTDDAADDPVDGTTEDTAEDPTDDSSTDPVDDPEQAPSEDATDPGSDEVAAPVACDAARNHGEYVSSVAQTTPPGPGHGAAVSEAARSDCGKAAAGEDSEPPADDPTEDPTDGATDESAQTDDSGDVGAGRTGAPTASPGNSANAPGHHKTDKPKPQKPAKKTKPGK